MEAYEVEISRTYAGYVHDAEAEGYQRPRVAALAALLALVTDPLGVSDEEMSAAHFILMRFRKIPE